MTTLKLSLVFSLFLLFHDANAFNITKMLDQYPDFTTFNSYLTQTNLASQINSRQTITVLVVDNGNISPLSGLSADVLKKTLSVHVILDYYDVQKIQELSNVSTIVTTLFQTSGLANGQQGFLNVTRLGTDSIAFGSAVPGSTLGSNLVKSVVSEPYNISVLQVTNVIIPPGIDSAATNSSSNSSPPPSPSKAPSTSPSAPPKPSVSPSMSPKASVSPSISPKASPPKSRPTAPPTPSRAPAANAPAKGVTPAASPRSAPKANAPISNAPAADAPVPNGPAADSPLLNTPAADAAVSNSPDAGTTLHIGLAVLLTMVLSTICVA